MEYLIILIIPLTWLLFESDFMTIRLPVGKVTKATQPIAIDTLAWDEDIITESEYDCVLEAKEYAKRFA